MTKNKRCANCAVPKPAHDFHRATKAGDGLQSYCIVCQRRHQKRLKAEALWWRALTLEERDRVHRSLEPELAKTRMRRRHLELATLAGVAPPKAAKNLRT